MADAYQLGSDLCAALPAAFRHVLERRHRGPSGVCRMGVGRKLPQGIPV